MARYGGGTEDFDAEARKLDALRGKREELIAKEQLYQRELSATGKSEDEANRKARTRRAARSEGQDVAGREAATAGKRAKATDVDTQAIEKNTRARQSASREMERYNRQGQQLIRHPTLYGQPGYGEAQARPEAGRRVPRTGVAFERRPTGEPYLYSGAGAYDRNAAADMARQAQAKGDNTRATEHYTQALTAEKRAAQDSLYAKAAQYEEKNAAAVRNTARATQAAGVSYGTMSQQMHRHGALTSEFILAAARGETTLKELGNQALITAGKFGGWTAAAAGIFFAVDAIKQMSTGAIQAQAGVHTLDRVINNVNADKAQQSFSDLSKQFNVPLGTSVDAVYRMGQVFHNQADATLAAKAALYSFKTGEVDVASSTQNLIAIVNGFHLSATDLTNVYDQINQAQNTFGIRIADTEAGLAKAAGTYRNAGGDLSYLLGVFVAIQKSTGRSGSEIGTGISRAVNRIRTPVSQAQLKGQGVDVDPKNFQRTLQSALRAARRPGADLQQIATGLFGNQYARLIAPVLADQRLLNKALKDTSPEASKGSAQKELAKVLQQVDEQIQAVGNGLQRLGEALLRAGVLAPLGLLLKLLNSSLTVVTDLLNVFNQLPAGLRQAVVLLGEGYILMKAMRRFGGGDRLAGGPLGFLADPDRRLQSRYMRGTRDWRDEQMNVAEREHKGAYGASARAEAARVNADRLEREFATRQAGPNAYPARSPEFDAANLERVAAQQHAEAMEGNARDLRQSAESQRILAKRADDEYNGAKKLSAQELRKKIVREGAPIPAELQQPSTRGILYPQGGGLRDMTAEQSGLTPKNLERAQARGLTVGAAQWEQRMRGSLTAMRDAETGVGHALRGLGGGAVISGLESGVSGVARGRSVATRAAGVLKRVGTELPGAMRGIVAGLGPLDAIFAALAVGFVLQEAISRETEKISQTADLAAKPTVNEAQERARRVAIRQRAGATHAARVTGLTSPLDLPGLGLSALTQGYNDLSGQTGEAEAYRREEESNKRLKKLQDRRRREGKAVPNLFKGEISEHMRTLAEDAKNGLISMADFNKEMRERTVEIMGSIHIGPGGIAELKAAQAQARREVAAVRRPRDFRARFGEAPYEETQGWMQETAARISQVGRKSTSFDFAELDAEYGRVLTLYKDSRDPKALAKLRQAREDMYNAIEQGSQKEQDEALLLATNEGDRRAAFSQSRTTLSRQIVAKPRSLYNQARRRVEAIQNSIASSHDALDQIDKGEYQGTGGRPTKEQAAKGARKQLRSDERDLLVAQRDLHDREKEYHDALGRRRVDLAKLRDADYQDREQGRQIQTALHQSRTADEGDKANIAVSAARAQVKDALNTYGSKDRRYWQALTELNNAKIAAAQQLLADVNANTSLAVARAGNDPVAQAQAQLQGDRNLLATMRAHPRSFDSNAVKEQQAKVISQQNATQQAQKQEQQDTIRLTGQIQAARAGDPVAEARAAQQAARAALKAASTRVERLQATLDLVNANNQLEQALRDREAARYELLKSRTTDPVEDARLDMEEARKAIRGTKGVDRTKARANYNEKKQAYQQTKLQDRIDTVDFNLELEKITSAEAISQLESLLRTRGLTKQMRRDLMRRIHQLKKEGDQEASGFDLDVGSIKLPTLYDVRKAWDPIRSQVRAQAEQSLKGANAHRRAADLARERAADPLTGGAIAPPVTNVQASLVVNVYDKGAVGAVYQALDETLRTGVRAQMRSRGHRRKKR